MLLTNARSYRNTIVDSDHRVVVSTFNMGFRFLAFKKPKSAIAL